MMRSAKMMLKMVGNGIPEVSKRSRSSSGVVTNPKQSVKVLVLN